MGIAAHYFFSAVVLAVYGGQVCPYIDSLNLLSWVALLSVVFLLMAAARSQLTGLYLAGTPPENLPLRHFRMDLSLFIGGGLFITLFDMLAFHFPIGSGLKILLGFLGLGFFVAVDSALLAERRTAEEIARTGKGVVPAGRYLPITGKFAAVAGVTVLLIVGVIFLLIKRDFVWLAGLGPNKQTSGAVSILVELLFVSAVILLELFNLIRAFSRNLGMFLNNENGALGHVAAGDLEASVPVSTNDEFGIMGHHTNLMIQKLKERTVELMRTRDVTILSMTSLAEIRDNETGQHILRTQRYVRALSRHLVQNPRYGAFLSEEMTDLLFKSAPLHDIGKVGVPDRILLKPGKHTPEEFEIMKKHTTYGRDALHEAEAVLGSTSFLRVAREIAYSHHEKWDGSGYPEMLKGEDIPLSARLMALADVYDALISKRVYKPAFSHEKARAIILEGNEKHFDPEIVEAFLAVENEFIRIKEKYGDKEENTPETQSEPGGPVSAQPRPV